MPKSRLNRLIANALCALSPFTEMARGSLGRERMLSGVGIPSHQPPAGGHQEDLNNELLAVSVTVSSVAFDMLCHQKNSSNDMKIKL